MTYYPDYNPKKGVSNCHGKDTDIFFPEDDKPDFQRKTEHAKSVCNNNGGCPYITECLGWALANEQHGIWGGTTPDERSALKRLAIRQKSPSIYG